MLRASGSTGSVPCAGWLRQASSSGPSWDRLAGSRIEPNAPHAFLDTRNEEHPARADRNPDPDPGRAGSGRCVAPLPERAIAGSGHMALDRPPGPRRVVPEGGWGGFFTNAPQKKFWLGFIPIDGWPGYLQVKSAIDANHCRANDNL
jgi:hypothetical protein